MSPVPPTTETALGTVEIHGRRYAIALLAAEPTIVIRRTAGLDELWVASAVLDGHGQILDVSWDGHEAGTLDADARGHLLEQSRALADGHYRGTTD